MSYGEHVLQLEGEEEEEEEEAGVEEAGEDMRNCLSPFHILMDYSQSVIFVLFDLFFFLITYLKY